MRIVANNAEELHDEAPVVVRYSKAVTPRYEETTYKRQMGARPPSGGATTYVIKKAPSSWRRDGSEEKPGCVAKNGS